MVHQEQPETTEDGHFVVISGRRWRATDPAIPDDVAAALRRVLMAARRDVGAALRSGRDPAPARVRVQAAKVALGERGVPWWEQTAEQRRQRWEAGLRGSAAGAATGGVAGRAGPVAGGDRGGEALEE